MCGIVGYIGDKQAFPILIGGLHRLEYRGYDSVGVALIDRELGLRVFKEKGKVSDLESKILRESAMILNKEAEGNAAESVIKAGTSESVITADALKSYITAGTLGIAHTRWATHGVPNEVNAHPHVSQSGNIALVHNGIIENYQLLRSQLEKHGYVFKSETDTEVLVQMIDYVMSTQGASLLESVCAALKKVVGAYAICVVDKRGDNQLIVARKSSPLVVGIGPENKEFYIASDASPIAGYTRKMVYLEDEEVAVLERGKEMEIFHLDKGQVGYQVKDVDIDLDMLSKGGYAHFMLKEIFDQPTVLRDSMRGRIVEEDRLVRALDCGHNNQSLDCGHNRRSDEESQDRHKLRVVLNAVQSNPNMWRAVRHITIVSCGTSWHAGLIGKQLLEHFAKVHTEVAYASEFRYSDQVIEPGDIVIAISQSGETADTLAAIEMAKSKGAIVFGIVNGVGSSIARCAQTGTYIHVGPEIGVASTKAFTGQVTVLTMLALAVGEVRGTVDPAEYQEVVGELVNIPAKVESLLQQNDKISEIAAQYAGASHALYLGRGWNYPVALEGALKLKEISYIHAEGYPAAEMKHGPIALVDGEMPVVFIATHHHLYQKIISNIREVVSRGGRVLAVVTEGDQDVKALVENVIEIPQTLNCLVPLLSVIPMQLLSYHIAVSNGLNVDQPRNLAKSVTVE